MWNIQFFHTLHSGETWTGPQLDFHFCQSRPLTCRHHFHSAVRQIPDPPSKSEALPLPCGKPPEAHALHLPGDEPASRNHSHHYGPDCACRRRRST